MRFTTYLGILFWSVKKKKKITKSLRWSNDHTTCVLSNGVLENVDVSINESSRNSRYEVFSSTIRFKNITLVSMDKCCILFYMLLLYTILVNFNTTHAHWF